MSNRAILRVVVCGSVDDGKSTLIGRLLSDTNSIPDEMRDYARRARRAGSLIPTGEIDYSLITDGLESEREQGITIDVAYRQIHLSEERRIILADSPGHEQYTRNMAVAASTADACILLTDASRNLTEQTFRHLVICSVMGVRTIIVLVNKLDNVIAPEVKYLEYVQRISEFSRTMDLPDLVFIPVSGLLGINLLENNGQIPWYSGPSLISLLESTKITIHHNSNLRLQVQNVLRDENFRGYAGTIVAGQINLGDSIKVAGTQYSSKVASLLDAGLVTDTASAGDVVTFSLVENLDIARGNLIVSAKDDIEISRNFRSMIVWIGDSNLEVGNSYILISGPFRSPAIIKRVETKVDFNNGSRGISSTLSTNEIGVVEIETTYPFAIDTYGQIKSTGSFLLIDRQSKETLGAGIVIEKLNTADNLKMNIFSVGRSERVQRMGRKGSVFWITGLPGSGKTTLANAVEEQLSQSGHFTYILDGDNLRAGINRDLGFSVEDRSENVRRVAEIAWLMADAGITVFVCLVSPFRVDRELAKQKFTDIPFFEIFIDTPLETCMQRDQKGNYKRAMDGGLSNFTGVGQTYEVPINPSIILNGQKSLNENAKIFRELISNVSY